MARRVARTSHPGTEGSHRSSTGISRARCSTAAISSFAQFMGRGISPPISLVSSYRIWYSVVSSSYQGHRENRSFTLLMNSSVLASRYWGSHHAIRTRLNRSIRTGFFSWRRSSIAAIQGNSKRSSRSSMWRGRAPSLYSVSVYRFRRAFSTMTLA